MPENIDITLPKWLRFRYDGLWNRFGKNEFSRSEAITVLREQFGDPDERVDVILSELRKRGWLVNTTPGKYRLRSKQEVVNILFTRQSSTLTRSDLETLLKRAADVIRTRVSYFSILVLLYLKHLNDKWELEYSETYKKLIKEGVPEEAAREEALRLHRIKIPVQYVIPPHGFWEWVREYPDKIPERMQEIIKAISENNPELQGVIDRFGFDEFVRDRDAADILRQLVNIFSERNLARASPDVLGDAYEWLLSYFAPQKAKEGEVYTPREVIKLLVEITDPKPGESVYDPAVGSGGMLIISYKHVVEKYGEKEARKLRLYGQEYNPTTYAICRLNLYIHGIEDHQIWRGDSLISPEGPNGKIIGVYDVVLANPPWNQDGYDEERLKKGKAWQERFKYGFTPKQSADWAWIQHMIASANSNGRIGVVIDNGALFRGGKEKAIRKAVLEDDLIEAVILLPEKLFYNTGAPGAIIVLNKNKPAERKGKVLFINASNEYEKHPEVRKLNILAPHNIKKIVDAYRSFSDIEGFSRVVSLDEIRENDYNLNVTTYVFPEPEIEEINVLSEWKELHQLSDELRKIDEKIGDYLREIYG